MANAYSTLLQYGDYIEPYDTNLILKALEHKQTKFDANMAKLQAQVDEFASIDLLRPVDREYLNKRIGALVDNVNGFQNVDLSNAGITRSISSHIKQALDNNVMTAMASTQAARRTIAEIQEVKTKHPELYSVQNEMFATQQLKEWANSTELGASYGGESYVPYYDYQKELTDNMDNLHNYTDVTKITTPNNDGRLVTISNERLSDFQVREIAEGMLSNKAKQQLQIDGWYNYANQPIETLSKSFEGYVSRRNSGFDAQIAQAQSRYKATNSMQDMQQVQELNALKTSFNGQANSVNGNKLAIGQFLQTDKLMNAITEKYGFNKYTEEWSTDGAYFNKLELEAKSKIKQNPIIDTNEDGVPDMSSTRGTSYSFDETKAYEALTKEMGGTLETRDSGVSGWFNNLDDSTKKMYASEKGKAHPNALSANDRYDLFNLYAKSSGNNYQNVVDSHYKYMTQLNEFNEVNKMAIAQTEDEAVLQIKDNAKGALLKDSIVIYKGQGVKLNELLEAKGYTKDIKNEDFLKEIKTKDRDVYDAMLANAYAHDLYNKARHSMGTDIDFNKGEVDIRTEDLDLLKGVVRHTNSNKTFNVDDYIVNQNNTRAYATRFGVGFSGSNDVSINVDKFKQDFPEAYSLLTKGESEYLRFFDNRFDERLITVEGMGDRHEYNLNSYRNKMALSRKNSLARTQDIIIQGGTSASKALAALYGTDPQNQKNVNLDGAKDMRLVNDGENYYISQRLTIGSGKEKEVINEQYPIDIQDLPPQVAEFVNTSRSKSAYDAKANVPLYIPPTRMQSQANGDYRDYVRFIRDTYSNSNLGNSGVSLQELEVLSTREGSMDVLTNRFPQELGNRFKPTDMRHLINTVQGKEFDITAQPDANNESWDITIKDAVTKQHIHTIPFEGRYLEGQAALLNSAPSVIIHEMIHDMLYTFEINKSGVNPVYDRLFELYGQETAAKKQPTR